MKSAITLAQVPEAKAGPFVFHQPLSEGFSLAAELGFDAVELFLPGPDFIGVDEVKAMASARFRSTLDKKLLTMWCCFFKEKKFP